MPCPLCPSGTCETKVNRDGEPRHESQALHNHYKVFSHAFWFTVRVWLGLWPIELSLPCLNVPTAELWVRSGEGCLSLHMYVCLSVFYWQAPSRAAMAPVRAAESYMC